MRLHVRMPWNISYKIPCYTEKPNAPMPMLHVPVHEEHAKILTISSGYGIPDIWVVRIIYNAENASREPQTQLLRHRGDLEPRDPLDRDLSMGSARLRLLALPFPFGGPFGLPFILPFAPLWPVSSSVSSVKSVRPNPMFSSSSYARMRPSLSPVRL
jgi:hypothetical protein